MSIKFKRGLKVDLPTGELGEPLYCTDTNELFIGQGVDNPAKLVQGKLPQIFGKNIMSIEKTKTEGLVDTYTITYSDKSTYCFTITNGDKGEIGSRGPQGEQGIQGPEGPKGDDGLTVSVKVNGSVFNQYNGIITLPSYPSDTNGGIMDLSLYQTKLDTSLTTATKEIIPAINELNHETENLSNKIINVKQEVNDQLDSIIIPYDDEVISVNYPVIQTEVNDLTDKYNVHNIDIAINKTKIIALQNDVSLNMKNILSHDDRFLSLENNISEQFISMTNFKDEILHYYIGKNQKYKTITEAWDSFKSLNDFSLEAVFHIYKGVYKEKIMQYGKINVTFIGEDKHDVIWKMCTGYYADAPITAQGNIKVKNITLISDHSENPNYIWTSERSGSYAFHGIGDNDLGGCKTIIENCILRSYQNAGLGCGTGDNHEIEVINTEIYNHATTDIGGLSISNGALLYHSSNKNGVNQKLKLKNVKIHSDNGLSMHIQTYGNNDDIIDFECINVNCSSGVKNIDLIKLAVDVNGKIRTVLTENCYGNNVTSLNKGKKIEDDGYSILVTDLNNVDNFSFVKCVASQGGLNTPTNSTYVAITYPYQSSPNVAYTYSVQYAWDILNNFKQYKRTKISGVWQSWIPVIDSFESNILDSTYQRVTDFNTVTTSKFFGSPTTGCINTPNANGFHNGFYVGEELSFNNNFRLQYAWAIQDGYKKYKRSNTNGLWTNWVLVQE